MRTLWANESPYVTVVVVSRGGIWVLCGVNQLTVEDAAEVEREVEREIEREVEREIEREIERGIVFDDLDVIGGDAAAVVATDEVDGWIPLTFDEPELH